MSTKPRKQLYQFAHRVLPEVFFDNPATLVEQLSASGGIEGLRTLWRSLDRYLQPSERLDTNSLSYTFEPVAGEWKVILVRFPKPQAAHEPHYAALAWQPARRQMLGFGVAQTSRLFVSEFTDEGGVLVGEWLEDGSRGKEEHLPRPDRPTLLKYLASELE
ncbi:MAG: hypothetical protein HN348_07525 [Proteobacteria bacterium]|nr:hypothetical protein [Pseudomonadota bacterium]